MKKVVGIRFKPAGKVYDFDSGAFVLNQGDAVIVQTEQGLSYGTVAIPPVILDEEKADKKLKKVYRLASAKDVEKLDRIAQDQQRAHRFCIECIKKLDLQMNLFEVEKSFDESKYTFFFTAEVGIRNQAKMCGGIGRCGREICCSSFLEKFGPVSIRMAKEQNLSLNPTKISGQCGRLMCCLTYEYDVYRKLKGDYPKVNSWVSTPSGRGKIIRHNVMARQVSVRLDDGNEVELPLKDIKPSPN